MMPKLLWSFLVLSFIAMVHQSEGCIFCSKRDCSMSSWSYWSSCSQSCGAGGTQWRTRYVTKRAKCGGSCWYSRSQTRSCDAVCLNGGTPVYGGCNCTATGYNGSCCTGVDGGWSGWSVWTTCTKSCKIGLKARTRNCTQPAPQNDGKPCQGAAREQQLCNMQPCAVDGGWSNWSAWTSCNESCGAEFQERSRKCTQPAPSYGGKTCQGKAREEHLCNLSPCPVDGGWSDWSEWTSCESCGSIQERSRTCTSPEPGFGGKPCAGEEFETHECEDLCDVDALGRRL